MSPVLALTPAQITTLGSGNVTSINQLLGQLVGGNTTNQQLTALVNTLVTPQRRRHRRRCRLLALPPISTDADASGRYRRPATASTAADADSDAATSDCL